MAGASSTASTSSGRSLTRRVSSPARFAKAAHGCSGNSEHRRARPAEGALGYTSAGTLMRCGPSATDPKEPEEASLMGALIWLFIKLIMLPFKLMFELIELLAH